SRECTEGREVSTHNAPAVPVQSSNPIFLKTISGFVCQAWIALVSLVSFPIFIHLLGMEAFGLIGFYLTLKMILQVLDLGLTPTVVRELARSSTSGEDTAELAAKAGTFETTFAVVGAMISVVLLILAPWVAHHWLQNDKIPTSTVAICMNVMAIMCG